MQQHVFIARQPIVDRACRLVGYELLFRPSLDDLAAGPCAEQTTARVISDAVSAFGLDTLTRGKLAFINVNRSLLLEGLSGLSGLLPPTDVVIELLEDIEADEDVLRACAELRQAGYALALDDFVLTPRTEGLVPLANYVKLDQPAALDPELPGRILALAPGQRPALLAEKVETVEQFDAGLTAGFDYFQGFFFGKPTTQFTRRLPGSLIGSLRLLAAIDDPRLDVSRLQELIEYDPALCYRLLRLVNSARFAQTRQITSIHQAIVLVGFLTVRRMVWLWVLGGLGTESHPELLTLSATRARCCELLAFNSGRFASADDSAEGFLLGMCSLLDVVLGRSMAALVEDLPLSPGVRAALLGEDNSWRRILDCVVAQERGDWQASGVLAERAGIHPLTVSEAHQEALRWFARLEAA